MKAIFPDKLKKRKGSKFQILHTDVYYYNLGFNVYKLLVFVFFRYRQLLIIKTFFFVQQTISSTVL